MTELDEKTEAAALLNGDTARRILPMTDRDVLDAAGLDARDDDAERRVATKLREWALTAYEDGSITEEPGTARQTQVSEAASEIARVLVDNDPLAGWRLGADLRDVGRLTGSERGGEDGDPDGDVDASPRRTIDQIVKDSAYHVLRDAAHALLGHIERHLTELRDDLEADEEEADDLEADEAE